MNYSSIDPIVRAVLYEGATLFPRRPSIRNVQRWNVGCLFPQAFAQANPGEGTEMQTQCIVRAGTGARVEITVRFLHVIQRTVSAATDPRRCIDLLEIEGRHYRPWQEVEEKEVQLGEFAVPELLQAEQSMQFGMAEKSWDEVVEDARRRPTGVLHRRQQGVTLRATVRADHAGPGWVRLTVRIANATDFDEVPRTRDAAVGHALVSTHTLMGMTGGHFISMTDPPAEAVAAVEQCQNIRTWPVLAAARDEVGGAGMMLSSPIIFYDHPQIAPESAGDGLDGAEGDEMLAFRMLTLTDAEKNEMQSLEPRARQILERSHAQARGQMPALHGARREVPLAGMGGAR